MSTDYGFKCRECDEHFIVDNLRGHAVPMLQAALAMLDDFTRLRAAGFEVRLRDDHYHNWGEAVAFACRHRERGHTVVVCDEYNREEGQCWRYAKCPACGGQKQCALTLNHEGECKPAEASR